MDRLQTIIESKRMEIESRRAVVPVEELRRRPLYQLPVRSLCRSLKAAYPAAVIAEFKRRSPSAGAIGEGVAGADPLDAVRQVAKAYEKAGAAALSVLTDEPFFGGSPADLTAAKAATKLPVLRKDFIIDPYQVEEARAMGADAILLISECLDRDEISRLARLARRLNLEVLLELHSPDQLDKIVSGVDVVGVNNRDLSDFSIDVNRSLGIRRELQERVDQQTNGAMIISESGFVFADQAVPCVEAGFQGFLIGSAFMGTENPGESCARFITDLNEHFKTSHES